MNAREIREQFEKAIQVVEELHRVAGEGYTIVTINTLGVDLSFFPNGDENQAAAVRYGISRFGKMNKSRFSGTMNGEKDGLKLNLFNCLKCKIVGYEKKQEPVLVKTGEFREVEKPIYRCFSPIAEADPDRVEAEASNG